MIILTFVNCTGCWDQKIYEELGFIMQVGIEPSNSGDMMLSAVMPVVEERTKERTELIYTNANLVREFREKVRQISAQAVEAGKVQQFLISESLAYKGIYDLFDVIERDPINPPSAFVVITDGSPKAILEELKTLTDKPPSSKYIHDLIRSNIRASNVPESRIFQFTTQYFSPGIDPIVPILKLSSERGAGIEVTGSALFAGDKMVGKVDTKQTSLLLAMMGKVKNAVYISKALSNEERENNKKGGAITITKAKRKLLVDIKDDKPVVNISLKLNTVINEYKWNKSYDEKFQESIEHIIERDIKNVCEQTLKYTQEVGSDPLGVGDIVRAKHNNYWKKVNWEKDYKNVIFDISVDIDISNHGVIK